MNGVYAAYALEPLECLIHHEDGEDGRSVEHGLLVYVGAKVEHCGDVAAHLAEHILLDDEEGNAGRACVLLGAAINHGVLAHIYPAAQDIGRHVCDEGNGAVDICLDLCSVDGVVGGDVEIIQVCGDFVALGDVAVVTVLGACYCVCISEPLGLLEGLVCPYAGIKICGFLLQEVHCHIEETEACAASKEDDLVVVGNIEDLFPKSPGFFHGCFPLLGAVRD